jgi:hypothetical protein
MTWVRCLSLHHCPRRLAWFAWAITVLHYSICSLPRPPDNLSGASGEGGRLPYCYMRRGSERGRFSSGGYTVRYRDETTESLSPKQLLDRVGEAGFHRLNAIVHQLPGHWHKVA